MAVHIDISMKSCVVLFATLCLVDAQTAWSYEGGPSAWQYTYPDCGGSLQSPVDISGAVTSRRPPIGVWTNYNVTPSTMVLGNDGNTVYVQGTSPSGLTPLLRFHRRKSYVLDHVQFHWGRTDATGSQHTIAGQRYPLEMLAVHKRVSNGADVSPNQYAVVATLFQTSSSSSAALANIVGYLSSIKTPFSSLSIPPFPWSSLLVPFSSQYYSYMGSLVQPPCSEAAVYFINRNIMAVSSSQLAAFRTVLNSAQHPMSGNYRPIQPLNNRNIFYVN